MSVERFDHDEYSDMIPARNGNWVNYSDYAELEDRVAELEKQIEQAKDALS